MAAKLLLVEDDNNLREIYEARLQAEGYTIVTAKDGEEALVVAKAEKPDLIISDVMMPRISGFEMLDILRNTDDLRDTKVIMLTALGQADDKTRASSLGADRYLVKSQVTLEDIVKAAHELMEAGSSQTPPTAGPPAAGPTMTPPAVTGTPASPPADPGAAAPPAAASVLAAPGDTPRVMAADVTPPPSLSSLMGAGPAGAPAPLPQPNTAPAVAPQLTMPAPVAPSTMASAPLSTPSPVPTPPAPAAAQPMPTVPMPGTMPNPPIPAPHTVFSPTQPQPATGPTTVMPAAQAQTPASPELPSTETTAEEKADVAAQITKFADAPATPAQEVAPAPATTADDALLAEAMKNLASSAPAAPAQPAPATDTQFGSVPIANKKVIQPLNDPRSKPNLDELMAREEAKKILSPSPAPDVPAAPAMPAAPDGAFDPNHISL